MKKLDFFNIGLACIPEAVIQCKAWGPREPETGGCEMLIHLSVDAFKYISIIEANNSFCLRKQSSQKSRKKLFQLLVKFLKNTFEWVSF